MLQDNRQGEVDLLSHVARQSEHGVKRVVGRGIRDMLNWNHATGKGSIVCRGRKEKSWGICHTLLNVWRRSASQNLKIKLSKLTQKRAKVLLNLTQIYLEVGFMAEAAAVAAENIGHMKMLLWRIWRRQNLLLLLLSLLPGCPSSRVLLLLLTARCSNECVQNIILQSALKSWKYAGRLLTERTAGSIGDRHCSQGQGWDVTKSKMIQQNSMRVRWN